MDIVTLATPLAHAGLYFVLKQSALGQHCNLDDGTFSSECVLFEVLWTQVDGAASGDVQQRNLTIPRYLEAKLKHPYINLRFRAELLPL